MSSGNPAPDARDEFERLEQEVQRLQGELAAAHAEIEDLTQELEEKAIALANSRGERQAEKPAPKTTRVTSLIRSALATGTSQGKMRIAMLEEELARQAERHATQIARMEAHFVSKLAEVAGAGNPGVLRVLRERIVALEQELADPPDLALARATIGRLQAELEELRDENRFLSAEVEKWAALAQSK